MSEKLDRISLRGFAVDRCSALGLDLNCAAAYSLILGYSECYGYYGGGSKCVARWLCGKGERWCQKILSRLVECGLLRRWRRGGKYVYGAVVDGVEILKGMRVSDDGSIAMREHCAWPVANNGSCDANYCSEEANYSSDAIYNDSNKDNESGNKKVVAAVNALGSVYVDDFSFLLGCDVRGEVVAGTGADDSKYEDYVSGFASNCKAMGYGHDDAAGLRRHFVNWLKKRLGNSSVPGRGVVYRGANERRNMSIDNVIEKYKNKKNDNGEL